MPVALRTKIDYRLLKALNIRGTADASQVQRFAIQGTVGTGAKSPAPITDLVRSLLSFLFLFFWTGCELTPLDVSCFRCRLQCNGRGRCLQT